MRSWLLIPAALLASCAHEPVVRSVSLPGMAGIEAAREAGKSGKVLEGLGLLKGAGVESSPELAAAAGPITQELVASAIAEAERLRVLKDIGAYEEAVALLTRACEVDPAQRGLLDGTQREFDDYLWSRVHQNEHERGVQFLERNRRIGEGLNPPERPPPASL